jgi:hypothetical protein
MKMNKFWQMAAIATLIATTSGCVSYNVSQPSASLSGDVKTDLKADVKVGEAISGESSTNVLFGWLNIGGDTQFAMAARAAVAASAFLCRTLSRPPKRLQHSKP